MGGVREFEYLREVTGVRNGDAGCAVVAVLDLDGFIDQLAWDWGAKTGCYLYLV